MILNNGILELGKVSDDDISVVNQIKYSSLDADQVVADNVGNSGIVIAFEKDKMGFISYIQTNNAPTAMDDSFSMDCDSLANQIDVLDNDFDADEDSISISSVGDASHGSVSHDGNFVYYTPDPGFAGEDSFTYTIRDEISDSNAATVNIIVNKIEDPEEDEPEEEPPEEDPPEDPEEEDDPEEEPPEEDESDDGLKKGIVSFMKRLAGRFSLFELINRILGKIAFLS
jgi:hypothetical protein